jgi:hypothetical protein
MRTIFIMPNIAAVSNEGLKCKLFRHPGGSYLVFLRKLLSSKLLHWMVEL